MLSWLAYPGTTSDNFNDLNSGGPTDNDLNRGGLTTNNSIGSPNVVYPAGSSGNPNNPNPTTSSSSGNPNNPNPTTSSSSGNPNNQINNAPGWDHP